MLQDDAARTSQLPEQWAHAHRTVEHLNALTAAWHESRATAIAHDDVLTRLHEANFELWHLEDRARDRHSSDGAIVKVKRDIDRVNQIRNDLAERVDEVLLAYLAEHTLPAGSAPLHSETPGQMLDRLSILSLKLFHTAEEAVRSDAAEEHHERNEKRLVLLKEQQSDLAECLRLLWAEVLNGERRFKRYRQLKMYNDPQSNPVLYQTATSPISRKDVTPSPVRVVDSGDGLPYKPETNANIAPAAD